MPPTLSPFICFVGVAGLLALAEIIASLRGHFAIWLALIGAIAICASIAVAGLDAMP